MMDISEAPSYFKMYREKERKVLEVTYYRQNRKGKPLKISREKYLRSDINCGSNGCPKCPATERSQYKLDNDPPIYSNKFNFKHYLLPDHGFILRQVDILEELSNVIFLQTEMEEVWRFSVAKYKTIRDGVPNRKWLYFLNEHHEETYVARNPWETVEERNCREFLICYRYFQQHLGSRGIKIVMLSDDPDFRKKSKSENDTNSFLATGEEYVSYMTDQFSDLEDKLCKIPYNEDESVKKYNKSGFAYPPHLEHNEVQDGIKTGRFFQGVYRSYNFYEGFVNIESADANAKLPRKNKDELGWGEILIQGLDNVNRATDSDIIAIEILPEDQWSVPSGLVVLEPLEQEPPLTCDKIVQDNEEEVADPDEDNIAQEEEVMAAVAEITKTEENINKKRRTGGVVGIIRRKWKPLCGIVLKSRAEGNTFHFFQPDNKKMPRIRIETRNVDRFEGQKIVVQIDQWPVTSRYPVGHYLKILGPAGTIETETDAILHEHGIPHDPWSKAVEDCLPTLPYEIDPEELTRRTDFRDIVICSVDPPGCTDIDDALHCFQNPDGTYNVGVHIADVSHYVKPGTALDAEAAKRSTTVYLADRRIHMLPDVLSSNICSLFSGTEKLVFSCIWQMDKDANILATKFYKAVIKSKAAMTYAEAQARLNSSDTTDIITVSLKGLSHLAQILKKKRFDKGALMLSASEVNEEGEVEDECEESHSLVEEFMLLANCSVAEFTLNAYREYALLRRHPIPPPANFVPLLLAAKTHNINIIVDEGSKALNQSIENTPDELKSILRVLTTRCMTQAIYCCSGATPADEYLHYGLAAPLYTHFTSPIRRYADLMVHRLLASTLDFEQIDPKILDSRRMQSICENINLRHRMAQYASRASLNIHKSKLLKGKQEEHTGYIMFVKRNALQVFVPRYAMEGYIFFPKDAVYTYSEKDAQVCFGKVIFRPLDKIVVGLSLEENKDKVLFRLVSPEVPELTNQQ